MSMVWQQKRESEGGVEGIRQRGALKDTLSKKENSLKTPCLPTEAKD